MTWLIGILSALAALLGVGLWQRFAGRKQGEDHAWRRAAEALDQQKREQAAHAQKVDTKTEAKVEQIQKAAEKRLEKTPTEDDFRALIERSKETP